MTNSTPHGSIDRIIDTMIELARCSSDHRIILAGAKKSGRIFELRHRGYPRIVTTATCKLCRGGLVEWRQHSIKALEATLDWLVHFLSPTGVLVIWMDIAPGHRELRSAIERLGFRIETRTRCENGFAISARRLRVDRGAMAAQGAFRAVSNHLCRSYETPA
jgi:hypothetical protein